MNCPGKNSYENFPKALDKLPGLCYTLIKENKREEIKMRTYEENLAEALERIASGRKVTNRKVIVTDLSWQMSSSGCRECINVSMGNIYDAYNESRICDEW